MRKNLFLPQNPFENLRFLVVDENMLSRSVMSSMLRTLGARQVHQVDKPESARRFFKDKTFGFDVVICDYHFSNRGDQSMTGQDFLDELRQSRGLPMSTAFIMVTNEARYQRVADSVEGALDDYLLKPFSAADFEVRLSKVLTRKKALKSVFQLIEADDYLSAAKVCEALVQANDKHWLYAARIATELYLRLSLYADANRMFEAVISRKALPWARLGLARVALETENTQQACRTLESLVASSPNYADAYDVLGRAQLKNLQFEEAMATFKTAVSLTPGNIVRQQKLGSLAMALGNAADARKALDLAVTLGVQSKALDLQSLFLLSLANYDCLVPNGWERPVAHLEKVKLKAPSSFRVSQLLEGANAVKMLYKKDYEGLKAYFSQALKWVHHPAFDFEMACNVLMLWGRFAEQWDEKIGIPEWLTPLVERFSVSKVSHRFLERAVQDDEELIQYMNKVAHGLNEQLRAAMAHVLEKNHAETVTQCLRLAQVSKNSRVFAVTKATIERHRALLNEGLVAESLARLECIQQEYTGYGTHAHAEMTLKAA